MESVSTPRKRLRNRKRRRQLRKNRRFHRDKFEVRSKEKQTIIAGASVYLSGNKQFVKSMDAKAFWENYTTAQTWQQTHNVAWWKSRCVALEAENETLRETIQKLVQSMQCQCQNAEQINNIFLSALSNQMPQQSAEKIHPQREKGNAQKLGSGENYRHIKEEYPGDEDQSDDESFEFHVNEGMMDFLKQSIKHKMELKQQRKDEEALEQEEVAFPQMRAISLKERVENAKLLYGEASPKILGMETALQATIYSHKEKARPNYWPNIPLKL